LTKVHEGCNRFVEEHDPELADDNVEDAWVEPVGLCVGDDEVGVPDPGSPEPGAERSPRAVRTDPRQQRVGQGRLP
jgi:hypothetical protein